MDGAHAIVWSGKEQLSNHQQIIAIKDYWRFSTSSLRLSSIRAIALYLQTKPQVYKCGTLNLKIQSTKAFKLLPDG